MSKSTWALHAIRLLNKEGSWTGRVHIHKLLYLSKDLLGLDAPFEFELYRYGPYSFDLDKHLRELSTAGLVETVVLDGNYGPTYRPLEGFESVVDEVDKSSLEKLARLAKVVGNRKSGELELIATCQWANRHEDKKTDDKIEEFVQMVKPRYSPAEIRAQLDALKKMKAELGVD